MVRLHMAVRSLRLSIAASEAGIRRAGLAFVLLAAVAVRIWSIAFHTYVVWPDETFQYLEPAHRLAFGSGVVTWEFVDGIRSWLLPGVIAGIMRLAALFDPDPTGYIIPLRLLCVIASLSVPLAGFHIAFRRLGLSGAILTGLLCAFASQAVYFAPVIMTEPLATDLSLLAISLSDGVRAHPQMRRRVLLAGMLFGAASSLRYQYAPVLGVVVLLQHVRNRRRLRLVAGTAIAVVMLALGVLDAITLGAPFQSVWLNYSRNALQGVSSAMGTENWYYYLAYYLVAWGAIAPVIIACVIIGAVRVPALAYVVVCTIFLHSLVPHKELRFVFVATACMPMLVGIGIGSLLQRMRRFPQMAAGVPVAVVLATVISIYSAVATNDRASRLDDWHRDRSILQATSDARAVSGACGVAFRTIWVYSSGGYSYWHRDLPIYYETWRAAQMLEHSDFRLRLLNLLHGKPVPQYPDSVLAAHTDRFNVIVGSPSGRLPGFSMRSCFGSGSLDDPTICVFVRPGGCT